MSGLSGLWRNASPGVYSAALSCAYNWMDPESEKESDQTQPYTYPQLLVAGVAIVIIFNSGKWVYSILPKLPVKIKHEINDVVDLNSLINHGMVAAGAAAVGWYLSGSSGAIMSLAQWAIIKGAQKEGENRAPQTARIKTKELQTSLKSAKKAVEVERKGCATALRDAQRNNELYQEALRQLVTK